MPRRLVQITDCHLFADPAATLKDVPLRSRFDAVVAAIEPHRTGADRLIVTGDLTHDDRPETYGQLAAALAPWRDKLRLLPGNHDAPAILHQTFPDRVEQAGRRLVFVDRLDPWTVVGLDSHLPGEVRGRLGDEQLDWLDRLLADAPDRPTLLCLHHPPVPVGAVWIDALHLEDADRLRELVRRRPQVRGLLCGHVHQETTVALGSAVVFTCPSTAVQFLPETDVLTVDPVAPGFRICDLLDDGAIRTRVVRTPAP